MLSQVNHWMEFVGTAADVLLLLRVLTLRLHKTYLFLTLVCVLAVFFDGVTLWLGDSSERIEGVRVFVYSRFLFAFVFPVAAWDVFEELSAQLANIRRAAISRIATSLVLVCVCGLIFSGLGDSGDENSAWQFTTTFAVILWAGSASGSLTFLWLMRRTLRAQSIEPPSNTSVWLIFFALYMASEIFSCFFLFLNDLLSLNLRAVVELLLAVYGTGITAWCVLKLKALPSDAPSEPVNANS
jgi:hypothetical protein